MIKLLFTLLLGLLAPVALGSSKPELVFLTWQDYHDPDVIAAFEQQHNCSVRFVYFDDDDERNMIMANTAATGFDLVLVDHPMVQTYQAHGWLQPLTYQQIPNARHVRDPWQKHTASEPFYSVSYFWGGVGIVYRKDKMQPAPTRWSDLFQPQPYMKDKFLLLNTVQTTFGLALLSLGHPFNSTEPAHIDAATRLLTNVRPAVHEFRNIRIGPDSELAKGNLYAAVTYNGDAMMLMEQSEQLAFVYPAEGVPLWLDLIAVLKNARQPELAMALINFLNEPAVAARNAQSLNYATTNVAALALLPDTYRQDSRIFPDHSTMSRNQLYEQLPTAHLRRITSRFVQIMAREEN